MRWGRVGALVLAGVASLGPTGCGNDDNGAAPKPTTARFSAGAASAPGGLTVKSTAFADGAPIPERFSCKGSNTPPPLSWSGVPDGAKSVAVVVTDPDAPSGVFVHWIVVGLPAGANGSLTGSGLPAGAKAEKNSADQSAYTGMCPPAGETHRYVFEVFALKTDVTFPADASPIDKVKALRNASGTAGKLQGQFKG